MISYHEPNRTEEVFKYEDQVDAGKTTGFTYKKNDVECNAKNGCFLRITHKADKKNGQCTKLVIKLISLDSNQDECSNALNDGYVFFLSPANNSEYTIVHPKKCQKINIFAKARRDPNSCAN